LIEKLTTGPRKVLGLKQPVIAENEPAELTLFGPEVIWQYNETTASSLSSNSPFWNKNMMGQALAVINHGAMAFSKI
jgi:dihydroorotase